MQANQPYDNAKLQISQLTTLVNSISDGIIATDENGKILTYNSAALSILDVNTHLHNVLVGEVIKIVDKANQPVDITRLITETHRHFTSRNYSIALDNNEKHINIYLSIAPVKPIYKSNDPGGFVVLIRDITREISIEEEREEFVSVVSHELRTPVAIAEGNISNAIIAIKNQPEDVNTINNALHQAHDQILFLGNLINDLSTLSRAERGTLQNLNFSPVNVAQLVQNISQNYIQDVQKKGLLLQTELDPALEIINTSPLYLRELLQNLVTNAIKYTEKGVIMIKAQSTSSGVRFLIIDTGIGIGEKESKKIFEKFFRSEDYRTKKTSGTGLGLYITSKLAKLIGAKIGIQSTLNKGSTFILDVPDIKKASESST